MAAALRQRLVRRLVFGVLALALIGSACTSSGDGVDAVPRSTQPDLADGAVPSGLAFLGDLAEIRTSPVMAIFDEEGGSVSVTETSVLRVPPGALASAVRFETVAATIAFEKYATGGPVATVYLLSMRFG